MGEVDFTFCKSPIGGTFAFECTTDANRKIIPRLAYYTIEDESAATWTAVFRLMNRIYPHLNNDLNVEKVDGAKGAWAVFEKECR